MKYKITRMRIGRRTGGDPYIYFVWLKSNGWFSSWKRCRAFDTPEAAKEFIDSKPTPFEIDKEVPYTQ